MSIPFDELLGYPVLYRALAGDEAAVVVKLNPRNPNYANALDPTDANYADSVDTVDLYVLTSLGLPYVVSDVEYSQITYQSFRHLGEDWSDDPTNPPHNSDTVVGSNGESYPVIEDSVDDE